MIQSMLRRFGKDITLTRYKTSGSGAYKDIVVDKTYDTVGIINALQGTYGTRYAKAHEESTHTLHVVTTDIQAGDKVTSNGKTYQVRFVKDPMQAGLFVIAEMELLPHGL